MNIILIGYRASGKSSLGAILAAKLQYRFIDCDALAVDRINMSISAYVALNGWAAFRAVEAEILQAVLQGENQVVATGGGVVLNANARQMLKEQPLVVWLTANWQSLVNRINADANSRGMRPPLGDYASLAEEVKATLRERRPLYAECAGLTLNSDLLTQEQAVACIMRHVRQI